MPSLCYSILFVLSSLSISDAAVEFSFSTMYNIFDFEGVQTIPIPRCNFGCLIFASTVSSYQPGYDGQEPYFKNLLVYDPANGRNLSIAQLALNTQPGGSQKAPLEIAVAGTYSILNLNALGDKGRDVTVWIIERSKAHEFDYEIYDAATMNRAVSNLGTIVTVMSAGQFRVVAEPGAANSYTTHLTGFDNGLDGNTDNCRYAYRTNAGSKFDGFEFHVNAPIISIAFKERYPVNLMADLYFVNARNLTNPGFISSPGYNGCVINGAIQVHRSTQYTYSDEFDFFGAPEFFRVDFEVDLHLAEGHILSITDLTNNQNFPIGGPGGVLQMIIQETQSFSVKYYDITPPQTFMLRFTPTKIVKDTTAAPKTTTVALSQTSTTTSPLQTTTTSETRSISGHAAIALVVSLLAIGL